MQANPESTTERADANDPAPKGQFLSTEAGHPSLYLRLNGLSRLSHPFLIYRWSANALAHNNLTLLTITTIRI